MHNQLISNDDIDDFIILRARAFTSNMRRAVIRDVLDGEEIALLEWQLLFSIARFGSCHLAHITRHTSIDPAHGSRAATALEKKGYITRREDPQNKRRKVISLTPQGIACVKRIWPQTRQLLRNVTDRLSPKDFEELKRLLDLLNVASEPLREGAFGDASGADDLTNDTKQAAHG